MYLLGIDVGTSSIKVAVVAIDTQQRIATAQYPEKESPIYAPFPGWAEQVPQDWWQNTLHAILKVNQTGLFNPKDIKAIGIAYQMHGLVVVDENQKVLRNSIIWCDSRAVEIGEAAFEAIGQKHALEHLLNSPGNFTASKLAWVKQNEPAVYKKIDKVMLPGDYIAMKLSGKITTSISALSEGIFWDFKSHEIAGSILQHYGLGHNLLPEVQDLFSTHGELRSDIAEELGLTAGIPISYKAGDQPNNAFSLNVLRPGEVAATAGTSGVIYGVNNQLAYDPESRVNTFAHVNYTEHEKNTGILLCINGVGSTYRWARHNFAPGQSYKELNKLAEKSPIGSNGIKVLPFGNGAERMLGNKSTGIQLLGIDSNRTDKPDMIRAVQEGIAYAFRYGLDIMRENGMRPEVIRAGKANLFLSDVFVQAFVDVTGVPVELYNNDGSVGAALGAGIGAKLLDIAEAFDGQKKISVFEPKNQNEYTAQYVQWKEILLKSIL